MRTIFGTTTASGAVFSVLLGVATLDASVCAAADIQHGEELARRWCAECHVVAPDQQHAIAQAPPFATVAAKPDFDVNRLATFLLEPHPKMPSMNLTRIETADIAAYIGSLRK